MRYFIRLRACFQVYGSWNPIQIALRWPVALYINMAAVTNAWKIYLGDSHFATKPIGWAKTSHDLPEDFLSLKR
jgi:adsorption protein B